MQAHRYGPMLDMIRTGKLQPGRMVRREISLSASIEALTNMNRFEAAGVTVITDFSS